MSRVAHFEIHADRPERAIAFYKSVLGWHFHKWEGPVPYWLITTGPDSEPGINGGLVQRRGGLDGQAVTSYVCTVNVASVDATITAVESEDGEIAVPKVAVPGIGWLAYVKDTEGNIFGLMQADPGAV